MKVSELTGALLDYWAAKASGHITEIYSGVCVARKPFELTEYVYSPSSDWSQGGPIIEREEIQLVPRANGEQWAAGIEQFVKGGDTVLTAAMRCYVASKYGEEVPDNG